MIDNVYELKQRFVGFNKVKLLTVVFYCMTYSWCSFLNEYNAMENQEEEKENKGKWTLVGDAVVYECNKFKLVYTWDAVFMTFIDAKRQKSFNLSNNTFPVGYESAIDLVEFLYRYQDALGIEVEGEYRAVDLRDLPGCCKFCCKGNLGDRALRRLYIEEKKNELAERIFSIRLRKGDPSVEARKKWMGDISEIVKGSLEAGKWALVVIANLFDQEKVLGDGRVLLFLSGKVKDLIHDKLGYEDVFIDDYVFLGGVIGVENVDKNIQNYNKN